MTEKIETWDDLRKQRDGARIAAKHSAFYKKRAEQAEARVQELEGMKTGHDDQVHSLNKQIARIMAERDELRGRVEESYEKMKSATISLIESRQREKAALERERVLRNAINEYGEERCEGDAVTEARWLRVLTALSPQPTGEKQ